MADEILLRYVDGPRAIAAREIMTWNRGQLTMVMSASSGPKDYIRNQICALFESKPEVNRVVMVRGGGR